MPAAVLSVLVQARGIKQTNTQLTGTHAAGVKAAAGARAATTATAKLSKAQSAATASSSRWAKSEAQLTAMHRANAAAAGVSAAATTRQATASSAATAAANGEAAATSRAGRVKVWLVKQAVGVKGALALETAAHNRNTAAMNTSTAATGRLRRGAATAGSILALGLGFGFLGAAKAGADFEKRMDSAASVTSASAQQMQRLEKQALDLGEATAFSANESAEAQIELAKGGLSVRQILGGALPASLSLAAAGELELAQAATTTVNAMKLFGLPGREAVVIADMLATAANTTTADVLDFAMGLTQGGSAAKQAGLDLNETVVILESLAEAGIENSDAGTSMKAAILQMLAPTKKQAELAEELGISFVGQNGEMKSAVGLSQELRGALGGMEKAQRVANLKVLAGTDGFRTLAGLYDAGPAKLERLAAANLKAGTAQEVASQKMDNLAGDVDEMGGAAETLAVKLMGKANPALRTLTQLSTGAIQGLANWNLDSPTRSAVTFGLATTALVVGLAKLRVGLVATRVAAIATFAFISRHPLGMLVVGAGLAAGALYGLSRSSDSTTESQRRMQAVTERQRASLDGLTAASRRVTAAKRNQRQATQNLKAAEDRLDQARSAHGPSSRQALAAEVEYARAKNRSATASRRLRDSERLEGVEKRATQQILQALVPRQKAHVVQLQREAHSLEEGLRVALDTKAPLREIIDLRGRLRSKTSEASKANQALNETILRAARQVNPKFAEGLRRSANGISDLGTSIVPSRRALSLGFAQIETNLQSMVNATARGLEVQGQNTNSVLGAFGAKQLDFSIQTVGGGGVQKKQDGGFIVPGTGSGDTFRTMLPVGSFVENREAVRRLPFQDGGMVPVALEPGERVHFPESVRRVGADVLRARNDAAPRFGFQEGGEIGKTQLTGPAGPLLDMGRGAIDKSHEAAVAFLAKQRPAGGGSAAGAGRHRNYPGLSGDTDFAIELGKRLSKLAAATVGHISVTSGWRSYTEQAALWAANPNPAMVARPGSSNHEDGRAADISPQRPAYGGAERRFGLHFPMSWEPWHVEMLRLGGLVKKLAEGGWVKTGYTTYSGSGPGAMGTLPKGDAYAELGTATSSGVGTGRGLIAAALGMSGELPADFPLQVKVGGTIGTLYKRDRGYGQGDAFHSIDIHTSGFDNVGLSGHSKGVAFVRPARGAGGELTEGQKTIREAKTRKANYEAKIAKLRKRASDAKTLPAEQSALWQFIKMWGRVGIFDKSERQHLLERVTAAASKANPEGSVRVLSGLANWTGKHGEITGRDPDDFRALTDAVDRAIDRGKRQRERILKKHAAARQRKVARIANRGNFPGLAEMLQGQEGAYNNANQSAERLVALEPESLSDSYVGQERAAWGSALERLGVWRDKTVEARDFASHQLMRWRAEVDSITAFNVPGDKRYMAIYNTGKWKLPGLREAITSGRSFLDERKQELVDLQGFGGPQGKIGAVGEGTAHWLTLGGPGARIFDTQNTIRELALKVGPAAGGGSEADRERAELLEKLLRDKNLAEAVASRQGAVMHQWDQMRQGFGFAGMFEHGGTIPQGKWGIVGERGPEPVFSGSTPTTVFSNREGQEMFGGGNGDVEVYLTIKGDVVPAEGVDPSEVAEVLVRNPRTREVLRRAVLGGRGAGVRTPGDRGRR